MLTANSGKTKKKTQQQQNTVVSEAMEKDPLTRQQSNQL